jgi:hypothetical protein
MERVLMHVRAGLQRLRDRQERFDARPLGRRGPAFDQAGRHHHVLDLRLAGDEPDQELDGENPWSSSRWSTVVNGGQVCAAMLMLSNPDTATSSGRQTP